MDPDLCIMETEEHMAKAVEHALQEFSAVRTGKASPMLVENLDVHVRAYGTSMRLKQLASITTPEPRLIRVEPFDSSTLQDIDRAFRESKLGLNPSIEGKHLRIPIPELSQERRMQMVKLVKSLAEDAKIRIRSVRRDALEALKKAEKDGSISEDDLHRTEKEVQTLTDKSVVDVDRHVASKEKDIMTV